MLREGNPGAAASPARAARKRKTVRKAYKRRRYGQTEVTETDADVVKDDLGPTLERAPERLRRKPAAQKKRPTAAALQTDPQQEASLRDFIRRVVRSTLHQQILNMAIHQRLTRVTPETMAQAVGVTEREAGRVLEDWKSVGVFVQDAAGVCELRPSQEDLASMKEFLFLWNRDASRGKLMAWILEEEAKGFGGAR